MRDERGVKNLFQTSNIVCDVVMKSANSAPVSGAVPAMPREFSKAKSLTVVASADPSVRDRLMEPGRSFSKSELLVVRKLLANYPAAGLTTISSLAQLASVSDTTVMRLATRLGFDGFSEMQRALLAEVEAHMRSPLSLRPAVRFPHRDQLTKPNVYQSFFDETLTQFEALRTETATADYERATTLLCDPKMKILLLGGRFSRFLAGMTQRCLHHLRDGSTLIDGPLADQLDQLAEIGKRHVLMVWDYRRYQVDVVTFAEQAKQRGCQVILFTDRWKSPIAAFSDVTLVAPTETASPFDTLATPLAQVEAIIAGIAEALGETWRHRLAQLEQVRTDNHVTIDEHARPRASLRPTKQRKS
jgi:DNA-binding MurR/RpiR family transcriptional regulator